MLHIFVSTGYNLLDRVSTGTVTNLCNQPWAAFVWVVAFGPTVFIVMRVLCWIVGQSWKAQEVTGKMIGPVWALWLNEKVCWLWFRMLKVKEKFFVCYRGDPYFHGCWFVRPSEIQHAPTRLFYKREVFLSSIEDTNPLGSVISKCCVLHIKEYCSCNLLSAIVSAFITFVVVSLWGSGAHGR